MEIVVVLKLLVVVVVVEAVAVVAVEEVEVDLLAAQQTLRTTKNKKKMYIFMLNIVYNIILSLQPQNNLNNQDLNL